MTVTGRAVTQFNIENRYLRWNVSFGSTSLICFELCASQTYVKLNTTVRIKHMNVPIYEEVAKSRRSQFYLLDRQQDVISPWMWCPLDKAVGSGCWERERDAGAEG